MTIDEPIDGIRRARAYFAEALSYEEWLLKCMADEYASAFLDEASAMLTAREIYFFMGKRKNGCRS